MPKPILAAFVVFTIGCTCAVVAASQQKPATVTEDSYRTSLHYSSRGLAHWYAKENGGPERITGVPFSELASCNGCHVRDCTGCHAQEKGAPSAASFKGETSCDDCHGIESREFARKNRGSDIADIHFARDMKCLDCHTAREIHGDGTAYDSMHAVGALDARCENCHADVATSCPSASFHNGKLDCNACHVREVSACLNCHFDTKLKGGKSASLPLSGALFLVNYRGKVTSGTLLTFINQGKTMVTFAPAFSHSIMKRGRKCAECHDTEIVRGMSRRTWRLVSSISNGAKTEVVNAKGVIPVVADYPWDLPFFEYADGKWTRIEHPQQPLLNYSGYASPITREQMDKLRKKQP